LARLSSATLTALRLTTAWPLYGVCPRRIRGTCRIAPACVKACRKLVTANAT